MSFYFCFLFLFFHFIPLIASLLFTVCRVFQLNPCEKQRKTWSRRQRERERKQNNDNDDDEHKNWRKKLQQLQQAERNSFPAFVSCDISNHPGNFYVFCIKIIFFMWIVVVVVNNFQSFPFGKKSTDFSRYAYDLGVETRRPGEVERNGVCAWFYLL